MESFVVSARKYRPSTFNSVVGQTAITTTLKNAIKSSKLSHSYLFCGPRGVGKTTCARIFAKTINCQNLTSDYEACNSCESCRSFNEQRSYNIHELDAASNNSVDDIRSLTDQVRIPPQIGRYSVYIIDEVHMLTQGAFNAFLKTLEEPPAHAIFILATTEKHKIIPTILSRCQIYDFNRISITDTVNHLKYVAEKENVNIDNNALNVIAQKSDGGMRDALSIFDQLVSFCGNDITYQAVIENLNVLDYDYYFRLVNMFLHGDVRNSLLIFNEILNKGFEAHHFITGLSAHLRDVLVSKDSATIQLLEVGADIAEHYKQQAANCSAEFIFDALKISNECDLNYRLSRNKRLLVELALIKLCQLTSDKKKELTVENTLLQKVKPVSEPTNENGVNVSSVQKEPEVISQSTTESASASKISSENSENSKETSVPRQFSDEKSKIPNTGNFQRPASISISSLYNEIEENQLLSSEPNDEERNKPFTNDELLEKWNKFILTKEQDPGTKAFLQSHLPKLCENLMIEVLVDNKFQEKELQQMDVMSFLRKELSNYSIKLKIDFLPETELRKHQTPQEIYKRMSEENPALAVLRKNLDMEID